MEVERGIGSPLRMMQNQIPSVKNKSLRIKLRNPSLITGKEGYHVYKL